MAGIKENHGLRHARILLGIAGLTMQHAAMIKGLLGSEEALLRAKYRDLRAAGLKPGTADMLIRTLKNKVHYREEDNLEKLRGKALVWGFNGYPTRLTEIPAAPPVIFVTGQLPDDDDPVLAMIGSRRCTPQGQRTALLFGAEMADQGIHVVSGMARGIDSASIRGCLKRGGHAFGVLGCGLDQVYPPENTDLFIEILGSGALVSEFPLGTPPRKTNFPRRNRIISALSQGVLVVEASKKSGSLITVDHALSQNRPVMAIPGPVGPCFFQGTNRLIRDGACVVLEPEDVLAVLNLPFCTHSLALWGEESSGGKSLGSIEKKIVALLAHEALTVEEVADRTGTEAGETLAVVSRLELEGTLDRTSGARFIKAGR